HLSMVSEISGDQWNEGDVSCSVVRRVALPDAFFTLDGILQTLATILNEMKLFEEAIAREVEAELPFTSTTHLLMEAVKRGLGREGAHKIIQKHSLSALEKVRRGESHSFFSDLGSDTNLPLTEEEAKGIAMDTRDLVGSSKSQIEAVRARIGSITGASVDSFEAIR
ncbi:MAG: adenylosuccinate lyase, partial [Candidatus Nanopelagicaceae bacterium]